MERLQATPAADAELPRRRRASDPHAAWPPCAPRPTSRSRRTIRPSLRSYVYKIHRNAALASQVTNQLLSHTMVSHRGQVATREPVDLVTLLRQVAQRAEAGGVSPPIELDLRALDRPGAGRRRPDHAARGVHQPARQRPPLCRRPVSGADPDVADGRRQELLVEVADRGPGIAEAEKDRVLERFTRGSAGQEAAGSGLGLAIVKAVADAHRGEAGAARPPRRRADRSAGVPALVAAAPDAWRRLSCCWRRCWRPRPARPATITAVSRAPAAEQRRGC